MVDSLKRLCSICARGGSVGVKNKNTRLINEIPLIAHSILQAKRSGLFDAIVVSSDSQAILDIASKYGVDYVIDRPIEMATSKAAKLPVIQHAFLQAEQHFNGQYPTVVDLDATSPLRSVDDIINAVALLEEQRADNVITASPSRRSPYFNLVEVDATGCVSLSKSPDHAVVRRQDAPECYDMNASIYVWARQALLTQDSIFLPQTRLYVMPEERSWDIDSELDFAFVSFLAAQREDLHG